MTDTKCGVSCELPKSLSQAPEFDEKAAYAEAKYGDTNIVDDPYDSAVNLARWQHEQTAAPLLAKVEILESRASQFESTLIETMQVRDEEIERLKADSVHTCHDECLRPACALRRENQKLASRIEELECALTEANARIEIAVKALSEIKDKGIYCCDGEGLGNECGPVLIASEALEKIKGMG